MHPIIGPKTVASQLSKKELNEKEIPDNKNPNAYIIVRQDSLLNQQLNPIETYSIQDSPNKTIPIIYNRPSLSKIEIFIDLCTLTLFIYTFYEFVSEYDKLPQTVDVDFGFDSSFEQIDKEYLALILLGDTVFLVLLSILQCFTHKFKYLVEIKQTNSEMIFRYTRYFISSYKLSTMALFMYATISIFKIIDQQWEPYTLYLSSLFSILFIIFGMIYYRKMNYIANNPFL
ncbi:unnamed protein product [Paramecium primaurelia]|uniref:Uncharacterized protein n=2 Tax=Paramecium TaxID=5884 RepID=A0A8S1XE45_9CILI|nr:unnamed protein product [Paramecium primaurelia]CAD8199153.1 unnamed protein product [Paramecium pentaurelia]